VEGPAVSYMNSNGSGNNSRCPATRRLRRDIKTRREKPCLIARITRDGSPFSGSLIRRRMWSGIAT